MTTIGWIFFWSHGPISPLYLNAAHREGRQGVWRRGDLINLLFQEMADDGHGTFNPRITAFRHAISQNAALGLEAAEALQEFGYAFGAEMNRVGTSVDMTLPEARKFRESWEDLRDEFQAFMTRFGWLGVVTRGSLVLCIPCIGTSCVLLAYASYSPWVAHATLVALTSPPLLANLACSPLTNLEYAKKTQSSS